MSPAQDVIDNAGRLVPGLVGIRCSIHERATVTLQLARARARDCHVTIDGQTAHGVQAFDVTQSTPERGPDGQRLKPSRQLVTLIVRRKHFQYDLLAADRPMVMRLEIRDADTGVVLVPFDTNPLRLIRHELDGPKNDLLVFSDLADEDERAQIEQGPNDG